MKQNRFSDNVYEILLWEFMQFAEAWVENPGFIGRTLQRARKSGQIPEREDLGLSHGEDVLKAVQVIAPQLFIMFVIEHPQMFDEQEFLTWIDQRRPAHPSKDPDDPGSSAQAQD